MNNIQICPLFAFGRRYCVNISWQHHGPKV